MTGIIGVLNFDSLSVPRVSNRNDAFDLPRCLNEGAQRKGYDKNPVRR